ncbi:hypothetical protein IMSAGC011_01456 [Lachnospiraceae bacterium]|nr:hypothetical protein IMSAGC011_01456 [Lachnospiraceae bacterium]
MRKIYIFYLLSIVTILLIGCSDETVIHQEANLIVTNYSNLECEKITIISAGNVIASSNKPIGDTQLCYFNINTKESSYTFEIDVEFNEQHFTKTFEEDFSKQDNIVLIGIDYSDGLCEIFLDQKEGQ